MRTARDEIMRTIGNVLSLLLMIFGVAILTLMFVDFHRYPGPYELDFRGAVVLVGVVILSAGILLKVIVQFLVTVAKNKWMDADQMTKERIQTLSALLATPQADLTKLKHELACLLEHLSSPTGRTDRNCRAVDSFFCFDDSWPKRKLPRDFHDLLADMGGALHNTVTYPEIARDCESTPEQLLERARRLSAEP